MSQLIPETIIIETTERVDAIPVPELGLYKHKETGDLISVHSINMENEHVSASAGKEHVYNIEPSMLGTTYEFIPNSDLFIDEEIARTNADMLAMSQTSVEFDNRVLNFKPRVADDGESISTSLTPQGGTPEDAKKAVAIFRNDVIKFQKAMTAKQEYLKNLIYLKTTALKHRLNEQSLALDAKVKELEAFAKKANEAIWTINLYLGKDCHYVQIRTGKAAAKDEPIAIRQLVLYMDEECVLDETGKRFGHENIADFDAWLIEDPKNLDQILPNPKGMVAIIPRRHKRDTRGMDVYRAAQQTAADSKTYFIIRNGEQIYRLVMDFEIGARLVPQQKEFVQTFKNDRRVGDEEYLRHMEEMADHKVKHFYRVALIIQGILDRTKVFHPLPAPRIDILNIKDYDKYLTFICDDEPDKTFGTGRPTFADWLAEANDGMCVGQRVMGCFVSNYSYSTREREDKRCYPPNAKAPDDNELYTLDDKGPAGSFYFHYDRKESVYKGYGRGYGPAETRARYLVKHDDKLLLNFDAPNVTVEAMEFYMASRTERHQYAEMHPLLRRAIALKHREIAQEAPFIKLLTGMVAKKHSVSYEVAAAAVPGLVQWWKFKCQTHRALASNDKSAIAMIVDEFGIRNKRNRERSAWESDPLVVSLVEQIKSQQSQPILIAHKAKNEFIALLAHNDENVYVTEQLWAVNRSSSCPADKRIRLKDSKEWRTVDSRPERWQALYTDNRFKEWIRDSRVKGYLTDPERQQLLDAGKTVYQRVVAASLHHKDNSDFVNIYVSLVCDDDEGGAELTRYGVTWTRGSNGQIKPRVSKSGSTLCALTGKYGDRFHETLDAYKKSDIPWLNTYQFQSDFAKTIYVDDIMVSDHLKINQAAWLKRRWNGVISNIRRGISSNISNHIKNRAEENAKFEYLKEHGDIELWDDHRKTIKVTDDWTEDLATAISSCLKILICDQKLDLNGWTLQKVLDVAWPQWDQEAEKANNWRHEEIEKPILCVSDANYTIKHKPIPATPEDVKDDD